MSLPAAKGTVIAALVRNLGGLASAAIAARREPTQERLQAQLDRVRYFAAALAQAIQHGPYDAEDGANISRWARGVPLQAAFWRVVGGLRALERRPDLALEPAGLATVQLTSDLLQAWRGAISQVVVEERAQLGDLALVALLAAPAGALRALAAVGVASVTTEDLDAVRRAAEDAAGWAAGWVGPAALLLLLVFGLASWGGGRR